MSTGPHSRGRRGRVGGREGRCRGPRGGRGEGGGDSVGGLRGSTTRLAWSERERESKCEIHVGCYNINGISETRHTNVIFSIVMLIEC